MPWFKKKQTCVHCHKTKTRRLFEGEPTCPQCEIIVRMEREQVHRCPIDGAKMNKEALDEIIIDRCPQCNGVWLDGGELETIKKASEEADASFATGLMMGMVMD